MSYPPNIGEPIKKAIVTTIPKKKDIYEVGTIATILQLIKLPDGTVKVLVEGFQRAKLIEIKDYKDYISKLKAGEFG